MLSLSNGNGLLNSSIFDRLNAWVDYNHCEVTLQAGFDSADLLNRVYSMGLAFKVIPGPYKVSTARSFIYLAVLTFRRLFFPLGK